MARRELLEISGATVRNERIGAAGGGTYSPAPQFQRQGRIHAGEASGLMDPLWGFGVRCSMESGRLAAQALLGQTDYAVTSEERFGPLVRAGTVNRWLYEICGHPGYRHILRSAHASGDFRRFLGRIASPSLLKRLGFQVASRFLERKQSRPARTPP